MAEHPLHLVLRTHAERYPDMQVIDLYKLLHQLTFSIGHRITSEKSEREWLEHEFRIYTPNSKDMMLENISTDQTLLRLHLRPYMAAGGTLEPLLAAYIRTGQVKQGNAAQMEANWQQLEAWLQANPKLQQRFPAIDVRMVGRVQRENQWAAVQHSPEFFRAYNPAYRVLTTEEARKLLDSIGLALKLG